MMRRVWLETVAKQFLLLLLRVIYLLILQTISVSDAIIEPLATIGVLFCRQDIALWVILV